MALASPAVAQSGEDDPACFDALVVASLVRQTATIPESVGAAMSRFPFILHLNVTRVLTGQVLLGRIAALSYQHSYYYNLPAQRWWLRRNSDGGFNVLGFYRPGDTPPPRCAPGSAPERAYISPNPGETLDDLERASQDFWRFYDATPSTARFVALPELPDQFISLPERGSNASEHDIWLFRFTRDDNIAVDPAAGPRIGVVERMTINCRLRQQRSTVIGDIDGVGRLSNSRFLDGRSRSFGGAPGAIGAFVCSRRASSSPSISFADLAARGANPMPVVPIDSAINDR